MPSKYAVTYFDGRGLAEPIRYLLMYMEVDYEDRRLTRDEWTKLKPSAPFGKLPTLEVDGKTYAQSVPIYRYLGKLADLAGDNDLEDLQIDIIADVICDLRTGVVDYLYETDEAKKAIKKETLLKETLPFYFKKFEDIAKHNGGYLANKKMSWADFLFASTTENFGLGFAGPNLLADYPKLKALQEKILGIPQIKSYISKRKDSPF